MKFLVVVTICIFGSTISAAKAAESQKFSSQAAALAALTAPKPSDTKGATTTTTTEDDDDVEEIPVDTPTTSNAQVNIPVAGETGQL